MRNIVPTQDINALTTCVSQYSDEVLDAAIAQGHFTNVQLAAISQARQLAAAQGIAATATAGFSTTLKGLSVSLSSLAKAHPVLLAITGAIAIISTFITIADALTISTKEQEEAFHNAQKEYENAKSKLNELNSEMQTAQSRIEELQKKADNGSITLVEEEELEKLRLTTAELERQIQDQEILKKENAKNTSEEAIKTFDKKNKTDDEMKQKQEQLYNSSFYGGQFMTGSFSYSAGKDLDSLDYYDYAIKENESKIKEYQNNLKNLRKDLEKSVDESQKEDINDNIDYYQNLMDVLTISNEKLQENMEKIKPDIQKKAQESFSDKMTEYNEYKNALMNSMNPDGTFDDENMQKTWDDITKKQKKLYEYAGYSNDWNKIQFDTAFKVSDEELDQIFNSLKTVKQDDTTLITEKDVENSFLLSKYLDDTNLILEDGKTSAQLLAQYLNESYDVADKLSDQDISWDDPSSALTESDDKSQTATLADLQSEADLLSTIQKELESTGKIGVSSMQSIVKQYPEAKKALSDYMQGIISEQQLFDELQTIYQNDADAYIRHLVAESQKDVEFFNCLKTNYPELFNELSTIYGDDVKNWTTAAQAKAEVTKNLVTAMSTTWGNYFMALGNAESGFTLAETNTFDDSEIYDHTLSEEENIFTATHKNVTSAYFINWLKALKCRTYVLSNLCIPHKIWLSSKKIFTAI